MANKIRIVTDSSAQFLDPSIIQKYNIIVVPLDIQLGEQTYREGIDLDSAGFFRLMAETNEQPVLIPPSVERFTEVYTRLNRETDKILSIHLSRSMHSTWENAKAATQNLLGRCEISVLDSQTISVGLSFLVEAAAKLAQEIYSVDEVVREVRKMIPRMYAIFYVETLDYLHRGGLVSQSQAILGGMLGVKPFLTIEEGELITMEKVRTKPQAIDKLVEFVTEFADVDQLVVLQNTTQITEQTRMLQDRLALEFSPRPFPVLMYNSSLGTYVGPDAMGIIVFESESDDFDGTLDEM